MAHPGPSESIDNIGNNTHDDIPCSSNQCTNGQSKEINSLPKPNSRKRPHVNSPYLEKLNRMLDIKMFAQQVEQYVDQPIKIPIYLTPKARDRSIPGQPKRDLLSTKHIWSNTEESKADLSTLFNTSSVGERKWLLDELLEESEPDMDEEEEITDENIKALLKIHRDRRKFQKQYHGNIMNSQYTYYGSGLISEQDRFHEHRSSVIKKSAEGVSFNRRLPPD